MELAKEFVAGVLTKDFIKPARVWFGVFGGKNLDDVALFELGIEANHLAIHDGAGTLGANLAMKAISKVERHRALRQIDNVTLWRVDEDFVGKEVEFELLLVNLLAGSELGGGLLELLDPEQVSREFTDATFGVIVGELLLVVIEAGGKTTLGEVVHFTGANLEFDYLFAGGNDRSVK